MSDRPKDELLLMFSYEHLPKHLADISKGFHDLAHELCVLLPSNRERSTMLRKLLEAKDCAVRAEVFKNDIRSFG